MRILAYVALAFVLSACAHAGSHFYPASPDEAVPGQPEAATAESAGVRLTVHAGDWRGGPDDLEDRLTPVEVYIENESGKQVSVGPEQFGLLAQNGFRYQALDPREVQRLVGQSYRGAVVYYGFYGAYPWPGFWRPYRHHFYPYMGFGWYGPPPVAYWAPAPAPQAPPAPRGTLDPGGNISMLLFFPLPAATLGNFELSMSLAEPGGHAFGTVRVPMTRQAPSQRPSQTPAPAPSQAPPAPSPPAAQPPPPPSQPPAPPPTR